jgi:uncharacterized protein DUF6090
MIKFFRKIRQELMVKGKTGKYLKYAISEIVLVVIGILIALALNNLNETRKFNIRSAAYLERLHEDFEIIKSDVEQSIDHIQGLLNRSIISRASLQAARLSESSKDDFENYLYRYHQFSITIQDAKAYNEMLSTGELNLIHNRWIRDELHDLSDRREFIIEVNRSFHKKALDDMAFFRKYVGFDLKFPGTDTSQVIPIYDFNIMSKDTELINIISRQSLSLDDVLKMYKGYLNTVLDIKHVIEVEMQLVKR